MRKWVLLLCIPLLLCGCDRGERIDPVMFCAAFNRSVENGLSLHEENALLRSDSEWLIYADDVLLRLLTDESGAVCTAVVTAPQTEQTKLLQTCEAAFAVLAEPLGEQPPESIEQAVCSADGQVQTISTQHFTYLVYALPEALSVMQINQLYSPLPDMPSLRRLEAQ